MGLQTTWPWHRISAKIESMLQFYIKRELAATLCLIKDEKNLRCKRTDTNVIDISSRSFFWWKNRMWRENLQAIFAYILENRKSYYWGIDQYQITADWNKMSIHCPLILSLGLSQSTPSKSRSYKNNLLQQSSMPIPPWQTNGLIISNTIR